MKTTTQSPAAPTFPEWRYDPETGMIETAYPVDLTGAYGHVCDLRPAAFGPERGTFEHSVGHLIEAAPAMLAAARAALPILSALTADSRNKLHHGACAMLREAIAQAEERG